MGSGVNALVRTVADDSGMGSPSEGIVTDAVILGARHQERFENARCRPLGRNFDHLSNQR
jgi:hypothetical protein